MLFRAIGAELPNLPNLLQIGENEFVIKANEFVRLKRTKEEKQQDDNNETRDDESIHHCVVIGSVFVVHIVCFAVWFGGAIPAFQHVGLIRQFESHGLYLCVVRVCITGCFCVFILAQKQLEIGNGGFHLVDRSRQIVLER